MVSRPTNDPSFVAQDVQAAVYNAFNIGLRSAIPFPLPVLQGGGGGEIWELVPSVVAADPGAATAYSVQQNEPLGILIEIFRCVGGYIFRFAHDFTFQVDIAARRIAMYDGAGRSVDELGHTLLDHVIPTVLSQCGDLLLHASAARFELGVVALIGVSGAGKSTFAATMSRLGFPAVADDALRVERRDGSWQCSGYSLGARLRPDSAESLGFDRADAGAKPKRWVAVDRAQTDPCQPLAALCVLERLPTTPDGGPPDPVTCERLTSREAIVALMYNSYVLDRSDRPVVVRRLDQILELVKTVPVFQLSYPGGYAVLPDAITSLHNCVAGV